MRSNFPHFCRRIILILSVSLCYRERFVNILTMNSNGEAEEWKVLSLTHVEYQADDPLAKVLAVFSLLPLAVVVMFVTAFFLRWVY